jgi:hypothetical protein
MAVVHAHALQDGDDGTGTQRVRTLHPPNEMTDHRTGGSVHLGDHAQRCVVSHRIRVVGGSVTVWPADIHELVPLAAILSEQSRSRGNDRRDTGVQSSP